MATGFCKRALQLLLVLLFLLPAHPLLAQDDAPEPVELRIMTFNIWVGGELVDFGKVVEAIEAADADIVGVQEATGNTRRLADALGWHYADERTQIIARSPLINPPDGDGSYIYAQVRPGEVVAIANVHLPSDPYGPYAVRDGATITEVLALEAETRLPAIEPHLPVWAKVAKSGIPVLLTGDFNSPSFRDWTEEVAATRGQVKYPVEWPVSAAVEAAGFQDTYRAIHPDPVAAPGNTWTYGYPHPRLLPDETIDRIDLVYAAGDVEVLDSEIVGERGGPDVDISILPFPSDHRGVVSTVRLTPGVPPLFVSTDRARIVQGEPIVVRYHAPEGEATDRIVITVFGGSAVEEPLMWLPPYEANFFGSVTFGSSELLPGAYDAVLVSGDDNELARTHFWVVEPGAKPAVFTDKAVYAPGEAIVAAWENAPAQRWDWLGIYAAGDPDLYNYLGYLYTEATVADEAAFDAAVLGEEMLPPGEYVLRLMADDGYAVLASTTFTITR